MALSGRLPFLALSILVTCACAGTHISYPLRATRTRNAGAAGGKLLATKRLRHARAASAGAGEYQGMVQVSVLP